MNLTKKRNYRWIEIFLMIIGGGCSVFASEMYGSGDSEGSFPVFTAASMQKVQGSVKEEETEAETERILIENPDGKAGKEKGQAVLKKIKQEPSINRLNMAFVFPEGTLEPMDSAAGKVFSALSRKDAEWMARVYRMSSQSPATVAASAGKKLKQGETPESWGKVKVSFYDGDGKPISGYSNAREILSVASVYAYIHGIEDEQTFMDYAQALWKDSHSYRFSVSDFYYCDGRCLDQEDEEDEEEIEGAVYDQAEEILGGDGEVSLEQMYTAQMDAESIYTESESFAGEGELPESRKSQSQESSISEGEVAPENQAQAESGEQETIILDGNIGDQGEAEAPEPSEIPAEETLEEALENKKPAEKETKRDFTELIRRYDVEDYESLMETADPQEASKLYQMHEAYSDFREKPKKSTAAQSENEKHPESLRETGASAGSGKETDSRESSKTGADVTDATARAGQASEKKKGCRGHVDLTVKAYITGLKETKNLFTKDRIGNKEADWSEGWQGWSEEYQAYARELEAQDWFDAYGLTVSTSMYIRNPLSASEISYYMGLLPEDTSEERKKVIRCALESVGNIPYYWGGKPSKPGFDGNGFGTVVSPDRRGRGLRGLDCSGWVNWVYWTALGERLPYASTSGFVTGGRKIERSGMKPGDLIVRTGKDSSHVTMFLAWAEDGSMYLIHEVGNSTNNVTVGRYQFDWPYYRSFLDK